MLLYKLKLKTSSYILVTEKRSDPTTSLSFLAHLSRRLTVWAYSIQIVRCPSMLFIIFSSETAGPTEIRFYVKHLCLAGTKVYKIGVGHMSKVAARYILYGNYPLKIFFSRTVSQMTLKLGRQQKGTRTLHKLYKWWPWIDDLFSGKV